ncbi:unnamed protein product [Calypogeia fissa]
MALRGWHVFRQKASNSNVAFLDDHLITSLIQKLQIRGISAAVNNRLSADGSGSGGHKEPLEGSSGQDKPVPPEGAEDKQMWRKWIEERLAQSNSTGEETDASVVRNSQVEETVSRSLGRDSNAIDFDINLNGGSQMKETAKRSVLPEESSPGKRLSPLDSIFQSALKPAGKDGTAEESSVSNLRSSFRRDGLKSSLFSDRTFNKSSSTRDGRGPLFQESAKRPSLFSERQVPDKAPKAPLDNLPVEALDDFEYRVLGSANDEDDSIDDEFLRDLDDIGRSARGMKTEADDNQDIGEDEDWTDDKAKVLTDYALSNMEVFDLEDEESPYRMRPDRLFFPGQTYDPEDLDLSKEAAVEKPTVRTRKKYSSKEVFLVADFRNPRYLSKFIRESSRILPKRHYQISAKAQRKVAREIKTARILGLMPFTSMGDPPFRFVRSRSEDDSNTGFNDF